MDYAVPIDFESFGGITPLHAFTQMGAAVIHMESGKVVSKFNEYANQSGYSRDERCMTEFWSKFPDRLAETISICSRSKNTPYDVIRMFWEWLDIFVPRVGCKANIITDNAGYDAGILRCFSLTRDPLYAFGVKRDIVDVSFYYYGLGRKPLDTEASSKTTALAALKQPALPKFPVKHDHDAANDAELMGLYWWWFNFLLQ